MLVYRETYRKIMYRLIKAMLVYRETWGKIRHRLAKATEINFWRQRADAAAPNGSQLVVRNNHPAQGKWDVKSV